MSEIKTIKLNKKGKELPVHMRKCFKVDENEQIVSFCKHNGIICNCAIYAGDLNYPVIYSSS